MNAILDLTDCLCVVLCPIRNHFTHGDVTTCRRRLENITLMETSLLAGEDSKTLHSWKRHHLPAKTRKHYTHGDVTTCRRRLENITLMETSPLADEGLHILGASGFWPRRNRYRSTHADVSLRLKLLRGTAPLSRLLRQAVGTEDLFHPGLLGILWSLFVYLEDFFDSQLLFAEKIYSFLNSYNVTIFFPNRRVFFKKIF